MYNFAEIENCLLEWMIWVVGWISDVTLFLQHTLRGQVVLGQNGWSQWNHLRLAVHVPYVAICSNWYVLVINIYFIKFEKEFCLCVLNILPNSWELIYISRYKNDH